MNRRISAFTLIELTVVMLISGFLFGIAYFSLQLFQNRYQHFSVETEKLMEIGRLTYLLNNDFNQAQVIIADREDIVFQMDSSTVHYQFLPEYSLRKQQSVVTDTFWIVSEGKRMHLLGKEKVSETGLIDELEFGYTYHEEPYLFHFYKPYDAEVLMEYESKEPFKF